MKQLTTLILLTIFTLTCTGQSLFFNNLKNSTWATDSSFNETTFDQVEKIGLFKWSASSDSAQTDRAIWTFKDSLIIAYYNATLGKEQIIGKYAYEIDGDKGLLMISVGSQQMVYSVGIISTGNFAILIKKKGRKKKS